jgi:hypothetical protein
LTLRRAALALVMVAVTVDAANMPAPRAFAVATGIDVVLPAAILRNAAMQKQLTSGLTTVIVTSFEDRTTALMKVRGGVRIEIRYDLWEEKYLVNVVDISRRRNETSYASIDQLVEWWSSARLHAGDLPAGQHIAVLHLETNVVPFSESEEADAQRWLMHSMSDAGPSQLGARPATNSSVLDAIIGTSVHRRPILSWRWTVPVTSP